MRSRLKATQSIVLSFILLIAIGGVLLSLPIANQDGRYLRLIDAFFTSTSAVCVTGLVTVVPAQQFNLFGQVVLLILIQLGGLGLMVLVASFVLLIRHRFSLKERIIIKQVVNNDQSFNVIPILKSIIRFTFILEGLGALFLSFRFIPLYGISKGIYFSIWHSISAFCNAGFDILGDQSIIGFGRDWYVLLVFSVLIISAGIGFPVWSDLVKKIEPLFKRQITIKRFIRNLEAHTKLVLVTTSILLMGGAILFFIFEHDSQTMSNWSLIDKVFGSFFQSTTTRTAGFSAMSQLKLTEASQFVSIILMFIGGSPAGTAGGVKTITVAILFLSIYNTIKGREKIVVFRRTIDKETILKALSVLVIGLFVVITSIVLLSVIEKNNVYESFIKVFFEVVSAFGTVGLTLDFTPHLSSLGKLLIMVLMLLGRVGPLTLFISIASNRRMQRRDKVEYTKANIIVG